MKAQFTLLAGAVALAMSGTALAQTELEKLKAEVDALKQEVRSAAEWKSPKTLAHMAGYADVGYTDSKADSGTFSVGSFSPIFHYQFGELVMLEAELELEVDELGNTDTALEYLTVDLFLSDTVALVAGKFLSPLGQFRQNMHPSWINKMASAPVGYGHDQAAPNAEVGVMLRGGFPSGGNKVNYAVYIGNGPGVELDPTMTELERVETPGLNADQDGKKVVGGRLGLLIPDSRFEVGVSAATGKLDEVTPTGEIRDYDVLGVDFAWRPGDFELRGEYIQQEVGAFAGSTAPAGGTWDAWYLQGSYRFQPSNWEAVLRYGEYDTPGVEADREQTAVGVNYLFASNVIGKVNYEFNDNPNPGETADDRLLLQLAYGF